MHIQLRPVVAIEKC